MNSTVKRKFNALLQGISNRSSAESRTDLDSSLAAADRASSPSSATVTTMASDNKKRRVGAPTSTPTKYSTLQANPAQSSPASIRSVRPTTTISNVTLRKWTPGSASPAGAPQSPPKYCPGDRGQLLRRLATFQELTDWTPKPDRVNEIEWAKRGWVCQGKERVKCTLCARELVVKVNRREVDGNEISVLIASEIEESVVDKYAELIVEAHADDCLWRKKGCDDSLLRLPLANPKLALQGLRQRYDELCERGPFLPDESSLRLPPTLNLDAVISHLPHTFFTDPPPPASKANHAPPPPQPERSEPATTTTTTTTTEPSPSSSALPPKINRPALALALLGWQSLTNPRLPNQPVPNSASCHTCLRRLGLWMFRPREVPADPAGTAGTGGGGAPVVLVLVVPAPMDHLDPAREHRFFCPWRSAAAQRNPASRATLTTAAAAAEGLGLGGGGGGGEGRTMGMAAWEVLVLALRNEAFIRERVGKGAKGGAGGGGSAHGRSKSSVPGPVAGAALRGNGAPATPERPISADGSPRGLLVDGLDGAEVGGDPEEDEEARKKKDMDMMSRLRRVKSLFNTKAGSKLRRLGGSRPGTSHSRAGGE